MTPYHTDDRTHTAPDGTTHQIRVSWFYDEDAGLPWERSDGHGPVSDWTARPKRPGERILAEDIVGVRRYYDWQAAMQQAKREGWGAPDNRPPDTQSPIEAAVQADFTYLRDWCLDRWHYCGIQVRLLREDGTPTAHTASRWGIEDGLESSPAYHAEIIAELAEQAHAAQQAWEQGACPHCKGTGRAPTPAATPAATPARTTLDAIAAHLDGRTWTPDTLTEIAALLHAAGYTIGEPR